MELTIKKEYCKVFYYAESKYSKNTILVKISRDGGTNNIEKELIFKNYEEWKASEYYCENANFNCSDCSNCFNCFGCSNCFNCSDCFKCSNCFNCSDCSHCSDCSDCSDCFGCSDCTDCLNYNQNRKK